MGKDQGKTTAGEQIGKERHGAVSRLAPFLPVAVVVAVSLAVYSNTLFNGFVYDDTHQVVNNPWIRHARHLPDVFLKNVWAFSAEIVRSNYYRPLMHVVFTINYHIFGLSPWGFHLVNILFHAGNSVLVFLVARRVLENSLSSARTTSLTPASNLTSAFLAPPFVAAILFAVHPIHTEAVAWVSGLPELAFTFFYLLTFLLFLESGEGWNVRHALSVLSFFVSLLFKEPAITLPVILIFYDLAFRKGENRLAPFLRRHAPYWAMAGVYMLLRVNALKSVAPVEAYKGVSTYGFVINVFPVFTNYIKQLLFPVNLNLWHPFHPIGSLFEPRGVLSLLVAGAFAAAMYLAWRKDTLLFLCLLFFLLPLSPAFYLKGITGTPYSERYLYLPSFGFVLLCAVLLSRAALRFRRGNVALAVLLAAVVGLYAAGTVVRNAVWKNAYTLWSDAFRKSPDVEGVRGEFGNALLTMGRVDEAIEQFRVITLKMNPDSLQAYLSLGAAFLQKGMPEEAIREYQRAVTLDPKNIGARNGLAIAYANAGRTDQAAEESRILATLQPESPEAHVNRGIALRQQGMTREAIPHYEKALALDPGYAEAHFNLGNALADSGEMDKAMEHYKAAVRLQPTNAFFRNMLGISYGQKGKYDEAIGQFEEAVRLAPAEPAYRKNLDRAQGLRKSGGGSERAPGGRKTD